VISPRHVAILGLLAASGCAHAPAPEFSQQLRQGRCEDAASFLRGNQRGPPLESRVKQAFTIPFSYVLTGVAYTAEIAIVVGGGIVLSGVICSPVLMIEGAAGGSGNASSECMSSVAGAVFADASLPGVGRGIHAATRDWRCADMSPISEDLRAIAQCYAWRGGEGDLERARQQLDVLNRSEDLMRCVSAREREAVARAIASVEGQVGAPPPPSRAAAEP
jgi:hypothetical protein